MLATFVFIFTRCFPSLSITISIGPNRYFPKTHCHIIARRVCVCVCVCMSDVCEWNFIFIKIVESSKIYIKYVGISHSVSLSVVIVVDVISAIIIVDICCFLFISRVCLLLFLSFFIYTLIKIFVCLPLFASLCFLYFYSMKKIDNKNQETNLKILLVHRHLILLFLYFCFCFNS